MGASMVCDHTAAVICNGRVLADWEEFHCLPLLVEVRGMHGKEETNVA